MLHKHEPHVLPVSAHCIPKSLQPPCKLLKHLLCQYRNDTAYAVRTAAIHVWKSVVVNTPKTLRAVLPRLLALAIEAVSGDGEERQAGASRCLGELVAKMGNQVRTKRTTNK